MAKMTDDELRAHLKTRRDSCVNNMDSEYSQNRLEALRFYRGDQDVAYGDQEPGMSQVISRDTMEAIESMLPGLVKPFVVGDETVRFEPVGPEDEEGAKQATEYINYVFMRQNDAFGLITGAMKDGLLSRLGVAKVVWETTDKVSSEEYQGLDEMQVQMLGQSEGVKVVSATPDETGMFSVKVEVTKTKGQIKVYPVAPDEFLFERRLAKLEDATFLGHIARRTIGDLVDMGLDEEACRKLTDEDSPNSNSERTERFYGEGSIIVDNTDDLSRLVTVTECYIKMAMDGRKLCWYRVILAGTSDKILLKEEVDGHPFVCWTPYPIPHKLVGMSTHDLCRDIQLIKTALWREAMNNQYLSNRPMREVVEGQVNIDDLLTPRVGGVIRVKQMGSIRESAVSNTSGNAMAMIEYTDTVREQRTGSTRYNQGMDANSLNKTATGITSIMNAAGQRLEMVARQFGEQFMRPLFKRMLELCTKHQDQQTVIRLRNQWVDMDPRNWSSEYDMTVAVGLGTGDKTKIQQDLMALLQLDEKIIQLQQGVQGPIVTLENVHEKLKRLCEAMGLKGIERYYSDPESPEMQQMTQQGQNKPDPRQQQAEMDAKIKAAQMQADVDKATAVARIQSETAIEVARINAANKLELAGMDMKVQAFDAWAASLQGEEQGEGHAEPAGPESMHGAEEMGESPEMQQHEMMQPEQMQVPQGGEFQ